MKAPQNVFEDLGGIKSNYILKNIFLLLFPDKKLLIIKYNKEIQKKLGITLEDYKKECQYNVLIEKEKGLIKKYIKDSNILIFEGEYKEDKITGKGKEYSIIGELIFEGEYKDGIKINGKGYDDEGNEIMIIENGIPKEYFDNGKLQFKGEYYKGKRWHGKIYNKDGIEKYEIKYGQGWGREYYYTGETLFF